MGNDDLPVSKQYVDERLACLLQMLDERAAALSMALETEGSHESDRRIELERRLQDLNHAADRALIAAALTVTREMYDREHAALDKRMVERDEAIVKTVAALREEFIRDIAGRHGSKVDKSERRSDWALYLSVAAVGLVLIGILVEIALSLSV